MMKRRHRFRQTTTLAQRLRQEAVRLREKAKATLGPKYDLRAFDDTVVLGGNVPLDVLARNVDDYLRTAGK